MSQEQIVAIGQPVGDLSFKIFHNEEVKETSLASYKGRWLILFFYPADFTFICPTELEELADRYDEFVSLNIEIVSISADTAFVHKAWHDNSPAIKKVRYPMASDPSGALCKHFGTYIEHEGLSLRGTFIINPDGILKAFEMHDNSIGRSASELLRKVKAAQFVSANPGQVCPASWDIGRETLTPGLNLVGKI